MTHLTARIDEAFKADESSVVIARTKEAVVDELGELDPRLDRIHVLDDFNHTYRPDLVLEYTENGRKREREVFLRLATGEAGIADDLRTLADRGPIILGLLDHHVTEQSDEAGDEQQNEVPSARREPRNTLLTDAGALDALDRPTPDRSQAIATSALVRMGRGVLDRVEAQQLSVALEDSFAAAESASDPERWRVAASTLADLVPETYAERLSNYLTIVWLGAGGDIAKLPRAQDLFDQDLDADELAQILEHFLTRPASISAPLWRRIGALTSPDDVATILAAIPGDVDERLQEFVAANEKHWRVRFAALWPPGDAQKNGWHLASESLAFGMGGSTVTFTDRKTRWNSWDTPLVGPSPRSIIDALRENEITAIDATDESGTTVGLARYAEGGLSHVRLAQVAQDGGEVAGVAFRISTRNEFHVDFATGRIAVDRPAELAVAREIAETVWGPTAAPGETEPEPDQDES
jgi:hypothetical protein